VSTVFHIERVFFPPRHDAFLGFFLHVFDMTAIAGSSFFMWIALRELPLHTNGTLLRDSLPYLAEQGLGRRPMVMGFRKVDALKIRERWG
jgi:hypothetical protein